MHQRVLSVRNRDHSKSGKTGTQDFKTNLIPAPGDVDLGRTSSVAFPDREIDEEFTVPVRINTDGKSLGSVDIRALR